MRVLGLDPGTATTGYGIVEQRASRLYHLDHGAIITPPNTPFEARLITIYDETRALIAKHKPDFVGLEKIYFKQNITTGITVAQARGVLALAVAQAKLPIRELSPADVKKGVVGYGKATKQQVQDMVKMLLNLDAIPKPDDAADALAIAICALHAGTLGNAVQA
jgi:crossover junction endodeoxyribonuclease RuvC